MRAAFLFCLSRLNSLVMGREGEGSGGAEGNGGLGGGGGGRVGVAQRTQVRDRLQKR